MEEAYEEIRKNVIEFLKQNLRPEFLNRIDDIIVFRPLNKDDMKQIVRLQFERIKKMLEAQDLYAELDESAVEYLVEKGYDPAFGARPLRRLIQKELVNELAKEIIAGKLAPGDTVVVSANADGLVFSKKQEAA